MRNKVESGLMSFGLGVVGFLLGQLVSLDSTQVDLSEPRVEIAIVSLDSITGDQLDLEIFGPVRIVWGEGKMLEAEGVQQIPLGQLPDETDLQFKRFAYTANAKTGKFYPSTSYPARGTAVRDRRFFQTKVAAESAGFIPTKLVK